MGTTINIFFRGDDFHMKTKIKVNNMGQIQKINFIITQYPFDVWIHSDSGMVDAKSILGLFVLGLNEELYMVTEDDVDTTKLFKDLSEYITFLD